MNRRIAWGILILSVLLRQLSWGEEAARVITLEEALILAAEQSLDLQKNDIDLSLAEYGAKRLWAEIFPGFTLSTGLEYASPLFTGGGFKGDAANGSYSFALGMSLALNPGAGSAMKRIALAYRTRLLDRENALRQLEIRAAKLFYSLLAERENLNLLEEILALAERHHGQNLVRRDNGLVGELAVLQSSLAVETARYNLSIARGLYAAGLGEFLALLGIEPDAEVRLAGEIPVERVEPETEALIAEYLYKRPDIVSMTGEIERLELVKKENLLNARSPTLTLGARWSGAPGSGFPSAFSDRVAGSLTLNIPIDGWIPGTKKEQTLRADDAGVEKARLDLKNAETAAKTEIRSLSVSIRNAWASLEAARLRVSIAQRTYELTEEGFKSGAVESLTLADTLNDLADARQKLLQTGVAYAHLVLDLAGALNADRHLFAGRGEIP